MPRHDACHGDMQAKEEEKKAQKAGRSPTQHSNLVYDPDILQRVLAHRYVMIRNSSLAISIMSTLKFVGSNLFLVAVHDVGLTCCKCLANCTVMKAEKTQVCALCAIMGVTEGGLGQAKQACPSRCCHDMQG